MKLLNKISSKLQGKQADLKESTDLNTAKSSLPSLSAVIFIVEWTIFQLILSVFEEQNVIFRFLSKGRGTATSDKLDLLGLGTSDKAVITCLEQPAKISVLLQEIRKKIGSQRPGAGIGFTIPISAINSPILRVIEPVEGEKDKDKRKPAYSHFLIYSVINRGHSDEFMETARNSGASGGTVLSARYQAQGDAIKFFGISVQEEREIILILAPQNKKSLILKAIGEAHGLNSKAQGLMFSMPVDRVMSLSYEQAFNA